MVPWQIAGGISYPSDKHILLGRGRIIFNHQGNRIFRRYIDIHVPQYVRSATRADKTVIIRKLVRELNNAGYKFLRLFKATEDQPLLNSVWIELDEKAVLEKVAHTLRDRTLLIDKVNFGTTVEELEASKIPVIAWAEHTVDDRVLFKGKNDNGEEKSVSSSCEEEESEGEMKNGSSVSAAADNQEVQLQSLSRPRPLQATQGEKTALNMLLQRQAQMTGEVPPRSYFQQNGGFQQFVQEKASNAPAATNTAAPSSFPRSMPLSRPNEAGGGRTRHLNDTGAQMLQQEGQQSNNAPAATTTEYLVDISDIVVSCMQQGALPHAGSWKFFPKSENLTHVKIGNHTSGWKLKLEPIGFKADTISLDVMLSARGKASRR